MIGIIIQCRLGNQLFQYAFAKALAEKHKTNFFLIENGEKFTASEYFDLSGYNPLINQINKTLFKLRWRRPFRKLQSIAIDENTNETQIVNIQNHNIYSGYFQSAAYFENIADQIPTFINVKEEYVKQFELKYADTFSQGTVIVIHVRRGDYLNLNYWWLTNLGSDNLSLPDEYYINCIEHIPNYQSLKKIFVSDDVDYIKSAFGHFENAEFVSNSLIIDFQILLNADILITSNSSFSWWAAFLNRKKHKQIFCPKYWLGFKIKKEYPTHIIPTGWRQVEVINE